MKKVIIRSPALCAPRRVSVAEAKTRLSAVLRESTLGPTIIHRRGHDVAVLIAVEEYDRLAAADSANDVTVGALLRRIEEIKRRHGGGVDDFEPARATIRPRTVSFGRRAR